MTESRSSRRRVANRQPPVAKALPDNCKAHGQDYGNGLASALSLQRTMYLRFLRHHRQHGTVRTSIKRAFLVVSMWSVASWMLNNIFKRASRVNAWSLWRQPSRYHEEYRRTFAQGRRKGSFPRLVLLPPPAVEPTTANDDGGEETTVTASSMVAPLQILDPNLVEYKRPLRYPRTIPRWKQLFLDKSPEAISSEYAYGQVDEFETENCRAQYPWQLTSYPTCNTLHEVDVTHLFHHHINNGHTETLSNGSVESGSEDDNGSRIRMIARGYWRDVWAVADNIDNTWKEVVVLKTMRFEHDLTARNYDRHRRDAVALERLTKSPYISDIYGFCGNSGLFEYGGDGDVAGAIWDKSHNLTKMEELIIATEAAIGLAAVHNIDKEGQASMAHTDISPQQFIKVHHKDTGKSIYKLNDFNRVRFIRWSKRKNKPCGYYVDKNPGTNRSPEEYEYKLQSEKVDVYSFGNILYMLLQKEWPFSDVKADKAKQLIKEGYRPSFDAAVWNSTNPVDQVLKKAMIMCHEQNPKERATARHVETFLKGKLKELDPTWSEVR